MLFTPISEVKSYRMLCLNGRSVVSFSKRGLRAVQLVYGEYGHPPKAISLTEVDLPDKPEAGFIHVKWLASPINPADLNQIQGVYPLKPALPAVGGNEGYGRVEQIGSGVSTSLRVGDHVLPARAGLGIWRSDGHHKENELFAIDKTLSPEASATLQVNPPTAYRMLKDFVDLKSGDTVIQNGATSAVGRSVIQICRARGIKTVNVVRKRDDMKPIVDELTNLGANLVITEEQLIKEYRKEIRDVNLALNCVGGRSTMFLANTLGFRGCMVTYGGMSKQPLQIPTGPLIFKDIRCTGFWMSRWYDQPENTQERNNMYAELGAWIKSGLLTPPRFQRRRLEEHESALETAGTSFDKKQLFVMD